MQVKTQKLDDEVLGVLNEVEIAGNVLRLPMGMLPRPLYVKVDKALGLLGGKWSRKDKGHIFADDPSLVLDQAVACGFIVNEKATYQAFYTPMDLAARVVDRAEIKQGHRILEPSAGDGAIAGMARGVVRDIDVCEINPKARETLQELRFNLVGTDFLQYHPGEVYDRIVANPPFSCRQDVVHVRHMTECLAPAGRIVSIMSPAITFAQDKKTQALRDVLADWEHEIVDLPDGSFVASGTNVKVVMLIADKPL